MISVQKMGYSIFFIIKHHLNKFKFCLPVLNAYLIISAKKTLL
ncbi:hypothetical protein HPHPP30_1604 [Helicobacter pylori Hp P-30]|nr:hypothetical protein HPHPP30_1604 [Helicobacter pylori Hp P-30]